MTKKEKVLLVTQLLSVALLGIITIMFNMLKAFHRIGMAYFSYYDKFSWTQINAPFLVLLFFIFAFHQMKRMIRN